MRQPMPRNGTEPLKVGDRVQIVPEWQDPGDEKYERFVIEAPDDCTGSVSRRSFRGLSSNPPNGSKPTSSSYSPNNK